MRKISVFILCALVLSLIAPVHAVTAAVSSGGPAMLFTLDVCGHSGPSLSANQDVPAIYEGPCKLVPSGFAGLHSISKPCFTLLLIPSLKERPPKV